MTLTKKARQARMAAKTANKADFYTVRAEVLFPGMVGGRLHLCLVERTTGLMIPVTGNAQGFEPVILPINWAVDNYKGREYLKPEFIGRWTIIEELKGIKVTKEVEAAGHTALAIATEYELI